MNNKNNKTKLEEIQKHIDSIKDPIDQASAIRSVLIALELGSDKEENIVVVLIHGIRTHAEWQEKIKQEFHGESNIKVIPLGYDYLDIIERQLSCLV